MRRLRFAQNTAFWGLVLLILIAVSTRLVLLAYPNEVVFDEVHFGKFVTAYCCSYERIFDIHPPHGKLLIALGSKILGYRGGFSFEHIGLPYNNVPADALRFVPATAGFLLVFVVFGLLRAIGTSWFGAWLGAFLIALENGIIVQSRVIGLDSMLLFFIFLAVWGAFVIRRKLVQHQQSMILWLLVGVGVSAGLAAGVKFTGLAALGSVGVIALVTFVQTYTNASSKVKHLQRYIGYAAVLFGAALLAYGAGWWIHFALLDHEGSGDAWGVPSGSFFQDTVDIHKRMFDANYHLQADHPYSSRWWEWPIMRRSVFYWSGSSTQWIYFLGNPIIWWGSAIGISLAILYQLVGGWRIPRGAAGGQSTNFWLLVSGFVIAYIPLVQVPRALFLYHYLTPLVFAVLASIYWLDRVVSDRYRTYFFTTIICIVIIGFVFVSPITYGFSAWQQSLVELFPLWR